MKNATPKDIYIINVSTILIDPALGTYNKGDKHDLRMEVVQLVLRVGAKRFYIE